MLRSIEEQDQLIDHPSVEHLTKLWAARYIPNLSTLTTARKSVDRSTLVETISPEGRIKTATKLQDFIQNSCSFAAIQTNTLFSYIPNVVNLKESRQIAQLVAQVYQQTLELYQQHSPIIAIPERLLVTDFTGDIFIESMMPIIQQLVVVLKPTLQQLQLEHLLAEDRRTIGFITTQFHFSQRLIFDRLTKIEQVLLQPYFNFIEEQVCIPWQRVCVAASRHQLESPTLVLVEQMLPQSEQIAQTVYRRAVELYPHHTSRRGLLSQADIGTSTIRDLQMFQGFFWLCVLEGNTKSVEQELLPLCQMVFPAVQVQWKLVQQMLHLLLDEIITRAPQREFFLQTYVVAMHELFSSNLTTASPKLVSL